MITEGKHLDKKRYR